jgi:Protein of unknown function (DUF3108)
LGRKIRISGFVALMLASIAAAAQTGTTSGAQPANYIGTPSYIQAPTANHRFPDGQTLVFDAEWRLWTAGNATLRLENDGETRKVIGTANSTGVVALLFGVNDRFESRFNSRSFCSQGIFKHTEEGFHKKDTNIRFDYGQRKAVLDERNLRNNDQKHATQDIPSCVTDVVSGIYYLGSLPLQVGASYMFPLNDGNKTMDVRATVEGREQIKTDAGTFNTLRVRTEDASGLMKNRGTAWVWYTDDAAHIPVQMRARAFWGTLNFKLARVEKK